MVGLLAALFFLLIGLTNRSRSYLKTAGMIFLVTIGVIVAISVVEFLLRDRNKDYQNKETVLVAMREASPMSGIHLRVYSDSSYELGDGQDVWMRGEVSIRMDTLFLLRADSVAMSFVLHKKNLIEIGNTKVRFLEIERNEILRAY